MELAVKSTYSEQPSGYVECAPFARLQRLGKFTDVRIETKDGHEVVAHRVVLASRFPHLEQAVTDCVGGSLKWRRYDRNIVEAVVVFAYTGSIEISMDNAVRLFLMANDLGSRTITSWCAEFLQPRVSRENVEQIWSVANATRNTHMINICVPFIAAHFDSIATQVTFHSTIELDSLSSLLSDDRLVSVAGTAKLRTIANWFEANSTANKEDVTAFVDEDDDTRVATFKDLVGAVDLSEITSDDFDEFCMSNCWMSLPKEFRDLISDAWKEANTRGPMRYYIIPYTYPPDGIIVYTEMKFATSEWKEIEEKIIARSAGAELPTAHLNFRHNVPSRDRCVVAVLNGEFTPTHTVVQILSMLLNTVVFAGVSFTLQRAFT
uniref:BACK domain-containing protein n=1 Tax=Mesocestoides corti TaxID=53468 RepID=A0A5K3F266_MESCO